MFPAAIPEGDARDSADFQRSRKIIIILSQHC